MSANYPSPTQREVDECLRELREQRQVRERVAQGPITKARKRAPGLPVYIDCQRCDGTGMIWRCKSGCTSDGAPGHLANRIGRCCETVNCPERRCFDGNLICAVCFEERRQPRVEQPGPDYIVPVLATRMDGDDAVCNEHYIEPSPPDTEPGDFRSRSPADAGAAPRCAGPSLSQLEVESEKSPTPITPTDRWPEKAVSLQHKQADKAPSSGGAVRKEDA